MSNNMCRYVLIVNNWKRFVWNLKQIYGKLSLFFMHFRAKIFDFNDFLRSNLFFKVLNMQQML